MQSYLKAVDPLKARNRSRNANSGRGVPGQLSWVQSDAASSRKQIDSGPLEDSESWEQHIEEDQARLQAALKSPVPQSQTNDTSILTYEERMRIEGKKQIALTRRKEKGRPRDSWDPGGTEFWKRRQIDSGPRYDFESLEQHIEEDRVGIQEGTASKLTPGQAHDTRILTGEVRMSIENKKQTALTRRAEKRKLVETNGVDIRAKRKKEDHVEAEKVLEKSEHKKRKRDAYNQKQVGSSGDRKRKRKRVECKQSVQLGENKKKREREESHITLPTEERKRRKTDGQDGCNQLGSSTHKGIS
jgi:hypothetical protein